MDMDPVIQLFFCRPASDALLENVFGKLLQSCDVRVGGFRSSV